jgi:AraC family transcriptional regulator, transcriptional activator of pobA
MYKRNLIPQHDLTNNDGRHVSVNFESWGTTLGHTPHHAHRHNFHEILFFHSGNGTHEIDFMPWKTQKGTVHFVASENVHILIRDKETLGCSVMFTPDVFPDELLARLPFSNSAPVLQLTAEQQVPVKAMLDLIGTMTASNNDHAQLVARSQMHALLLYLAGVADSNPTSETTILPATVVAFKNLIQKQFKLHVNVNGYADQLHISPKHLIDLCKKHTGKTPLQHVREYTVAEAKRLLFNTGMSVKEVAYELNFDDPANFSKYFKSVCGYSPADYRKDG